MNNDRERTRVGAAAWWALMVAAAVAAACAQGGDSGSAAGSDAPAAAGERPAQTEPTEFPGSGTPPEQAEPVDMELASQGEQLFSRRGCVACHKIGEGRLVGPDLLGVTERRSYEWIFAMVTAPDSMLREDQTAKDLFAEYFTPMPDQKVEADEARALYEYMRARTEGVMPSSSASAAGAEFAMGGRHRHRRGKPPCCGAEIRAGGGTEDLVALATEPLAARGRRAARGPRAGHGRRHRHHRGT